MSRDYDAVLRAEAQRERDILAYGHAVAAERATYAAACAWHLFSAQYQARPETTHPLAEIGLRHKMQDAVRAAENAHREAAAALAKVPLHFRPFNPTEINQTFPEPGDQ